MKTPLLDLHRKHANLSRHYTIAIADKLQAAGYAHTPSTPSRLLTRINSQFLTHYVGRPPKWRLAMRGIVRSRTLPDFCLIGSAKCGTSDLAVSMMTHPNIIPPFAKEFWSSDPHSWKIFYPTERQKRAHALRDGASMSPYCVPALHHMDIAYRLSRVKPNAKIVIVIREPIARLHSYWKWEMLLLGKRYAESLPSFSTFEGYVEMSLSAYGYYPGFAPCSARGIETSIYWKAVDYWLKCFGNDNVMVLDAGEYFTTRTSVLQRIQEFVGLPYVELPASSKAIFANPLPTHVPNTECAERLRQFFKPHNERLWEVIGKTFVW